MNSMQVTVWLEEPKYKALKRCLGSEKAIEKAAQVLLEQLYEQTVPLEEREMISELITQARLEEARRAEAERRVVGHRIKENGQTVCFEMAYGHEVIHLAKRLRSYQRGELFHRGLNFHSTFGRNTELDCEAYQALSEKFISGDERVLAVFDIDLDNGTFAFLDRDKGWQEYTVKDISSAAFHTFRKSYASFQQREDIFWSRLEAKEINCGRALTDAPAMDGGPRLGM